jgi:hypothetical protein
MNGWYYRSSGSDSISWEIPVGASYTFGDLTNLYATFNLTSRVSLPSIQVNISGGTSCVFEVDGTIAKDNFNCQFGFNKDGTDYDASADSAILGYQQIKMKKRSGETLPADSAAIVSVTLISDAAAADGQAEFVATTVGFVSEAGNSVVYLKPVSP